MAENTTGPMCTEQEYTAAREAGLLFVTNGTTAQERAIHRFAEAIRGQAFAEGRAEAEMDHRDLLADEGPLNVAYAEGRKDEAQEAAWRNVKRDGMPPCDDETVFVGINTAGFACCFNEVTHDGCCSMRGPELSTVQMSGLEWWRVLDRPAIAKATGEQQ